MNRHTEQNRSLEKDGREDEHAHESTEEKEQENKIMAGRTSANIGENEGLLGAFGPKVGSWEPEEIHWRAPEPFRGEKSIGVPGSSPDAPGRASGGYFWRFVR